MKPLVSIITPTYNQGEFIGPCIESVRSQTFPEWEMVIVDDASTDQTAKIIGKYKNPRIRYLQHNNNYGKEKLGEIHNEALGMAKGEFVTVLEGDDYWPRDRLETQIKYFESQDVVLVHGEIALDKNGEITVWRRLGGPAGRGVLNNDPVGTALKTFLYGRTPVYAQSAMVRRAILEKIGGFKQVPGLYLVDYPTWMEVALHGKFAFVPGILGYWRRHTSSITALHQKDLWLGVLSCLKLFVSEKRKEIEELPVDLKVYLDNPGGYAYGALYKAALLEGNRREASGYLEQVWHRRRTMPRGDLMKVLLLSFFSALPFSDRAYRKYIKSRTTKFSPFF